MCFALAAKTRIGITNKNDVKKSKEDNVTTTNIQRSRAPVTPAFAPTLKIVQSATEQSVQDIRKATVPSTAKAVNRRINRNMALSTQNGKHRQRLVYIRF